MIIVTYLYILLYIIHSVITNVTMHHDPSQCHNTFLPLGQDTIITSGFPTCEIRESVWKLNGEICENSETRLVS